ncbi:MAG TPA: pseudouridine synthase, partial [bacterium]
MDAKAQRGTGRRSTRPADRSLKPDRTARPSGGAAAPAAGGTVRLQKLLSRAGVASRRAAEELIRTGHVSVDGRTVTEMGVSVDPAASVVKVDGRPVRAAESFSYYVLDKPRHVVCTLADPQGRATVRDLLPREAGRVYPVGRLDYDAEGVLLLTDDGDLAHKLMHPRFGVERTYHAKVRGAIEERALERLRTGVYLEDGRARAEDVRFLRRTSDNSWITMTLREGRHHEVKRMCLAVGHPVQKLRRVSYAGVGLGGLEPGGMRRLTAAEVAQLRRAVREGDAGRSLAGPVAGRGRGPAAQPEDRNRRGGGGGQG